MSFRLRALLVFSFFCLMSFASSAEDLNYFTHTKYFYLCSFSKECSFCESCSKDMLKVKIKNLSYKNIAKVYYSYYSSNNDQVLVREARVEGGKIDGQQLGYLTLCVSHKLHWAITEIEYTDGSSVKFVVDGPLRKFHQEADECDCNVNNPSRVY